MALKFSAVDIKEISDRLADARKHLDEALKIAEKGVVATPRTKEDADLYDDI